MISNIYTAPLSTYIISWFVCGFIIGIFAARKNRNFVLWGIIGGIFLLPGLLILSTLPVICPKCKRELSEKQWKDKFCPHCKKLTEYDPDSTLGLCSEDFSDNATDPINCLSCGSKITEGEKVCPSCGWRYNLESNKISEQTDYAD